MRLAALLQKHWKAGFLFVLGTIITKIVDQVFDLGVISAIWYWLSDSYAIISVWMASPVTLPLWGVLLCGALMLVLGSSCWQLASSLRQARAAYLELENPRLPQLTPNEQAVMLWVSWAYDKNIRLEADVLARLCESSPLRVQGIADKLKSIGYLRKKIRLHEPLELTATGRQYMILPEMIEKYELLQTPKGAKELGVIR